MKWRFCCHSLDRCLNSLVTEYRTGLSTVFSSLFTSKFLYMTKVANYPNYAVLLFTSTILMYLYQLPYPLSIIGVYVWFYSPLVISWSNMLVMTKKMVPKVKYLQSIILLYEEFFPRNVQSVEKNSEASMHVYWY